MVRSLRALKEGTKSALTEGVSCAAWHAPHPHDSTCQDQQIKIRTAEGRGQGGLGLCGIRNRMRKL